MDETKKIGNIIVTIVVLLALGFGIYYLVSRNDTNAAPQPIAGSDYYVSVVQVKHQFKNGEHTYVGSLDLPNACYRLDSSITKTNDASAIINLMTAMNTEEACAQTVTTRTFRLQVDGAMNLSVTGLLNGKAVDLNMFEVPAGQDIDLFEINIKG
jgi:hypothetical protein